MILPLTRPPSSICILRLSAIGDITHVLPVLRSLQHHWPQTKISWIIGKNEFELVRFVEGVEFIIFDKSQGLAAYTALRRQLQGRRFDVLLHMQLSLRASVASLFVKARLKLGFDRERAKDLQWLFTDADIRPESTRQHVLDSFLEFPKRLGLHPRIEWNLPISADALDSVRHKISGDHWLVINPCAVAKSRDWRNWTAEGYAIVADYAAERLGLTVVLTGGPSMDERNMADRIFSICRLKPLNLVGNTSLQELAAIISRASAVIAPDTGPAHIASAVGTPIIGLYAATNPQRAAPYRYKQYVVNKYPQALEKYYGLSIGDAPWGKRIRNAEAMKLIEPLEVVEMLERVLRETK
jgi:heptosyltransferase I